MPFYPYRCKKCETEFSISHGMAERKTDCPICESRDSLVRLLVNFNLEKPAVAQHTKPGDIVKRSLHEFAESLKEHKQELKEKSNEYAN